MTDQRPCIKHQRQPATRGFVCDRCFDEIKWALDRTPIVLAHLRERLTTILAHEDDGSQHFASGSAAPMDLNAWQLAEDIYEAIALRKIPVGASEETVYGESFYLTESLMMNLHHLVNTRRAHDMIHLVADVKTASREYPIEEAPRQTVHRCPHCQQRCLYVPAVEYLEDQKVACKTCDYQVTPEEALYLIRVAKVTEVN